ncbi:uncharacterized protein N7482_006511 [Penicillium canariense]|uniref:Uncharacterized protein n=1 Tax=Penicillium canariense TaxID=189055 RepID=A0A9W9HXZ0_9EURO|nr:uncharacterized protein N7482_006511 [Penicillium canariense]KAJ5159507.1 hypothetical protein N7482_006511 [Penicillium canariense]
MGHIPFNAQVELCSSLVVSENQKISRPPGKSKSSKSALPGQPWITIGDPTLPLYLRKELLTPDLNQLAPYLWMVATQDSSHISSLTHQMVRGRSIVITENPELHLVWYEGRVFVKPPPKYLLSFAFWVYYLDPSSSSSPIPPQSRQEIASAALGLIRSYVYLIRSKSDFRLARSDSDESKRLIPGRISFTQFVAFISCFEHLGDAVMPPRYAFGELRLSRLNLWAKLVLRRFHFHKAYGQYGAYFMRLYAPVAIIFAFYSVALNAMQVVLAAESLLQAQTSWEAFAEACRGFSVFTLVSAVAACLGLLGLFVGLLLRELVFALSHLRAKRGKRTVAPAAEVA